MVKPKSIYLFFIWSVCLAAISCQKQLDVGNPNAPTISGNVNTEAGLISMAQGGVYINGFGTGYFFIPWGYSELMADIVGADVAAAQVSTIGVPDSWTVNGNTIINGSPSMFNLRTNNTRSSTSEGANALSFQWTNMYALNNACNIVLSLIDGIENSASRKNTFRAWCYWWKGYAYASIGSMYYSGLIMDQANLSSNNFVSHDEIINQSNTYLDSALTMLGAINNLNDYNEILAKLIPDFCQTGKGIPPTTDMWIRNINTLLARNILANRLSPFVNDNPNSTITKSSTTMITSEDWNNILRLAGNGIRTDDNIFTGRAPDANNFFSPSGGVVATATCGVNNATFYKISERFIKDFTTGDKRLINNFDSATVYNNSQVYTTRYSMLDGGRNIPGVYTYGNLTPNMYELIIAGSYEENALIIAEANIRIGNIDLGLSYIDSVRAYQGAGVAPVAGTGLNQTQALQQLTMERRVALAFRGLSFYDSRRWGWIYSIQNAGGTYNNILVSSDGTIYNNATFNNNFLDYWDVPADETDLNPPATNSAPVVNPNFH